MLIVGEDLMGHSMKVPDMNENLQKKEPSFTYEVYGSPGNSTESIFASYPGIPADPSADWSDPDREEFHARWWPDVSANWG